MTIWLPTTLKNLGYSDAESINYPLLINFFAIPSVFLALYLLRKGGSKLVLTLYPLVAGIFMLILGGFLPQIAAQPMLLVLVGGVIFFFGTTLLGIFLYRSHSHGSLLLLSDEFCCVSYALQ